MKKEILSHLMSGLVLVLVSALLICCAGDGPEVASRMESAEGEEWFLPAPGIEWQVWGPETFRRARETDSPIFLYITARWSHASHLMEKITFHDADVIRLMNENYIPVRVDRDRLPAIDRQYQAATRALLGAGGWPLSLFLTPGGHLIHAERFLPPEDRSGRPGMRRVLQSVAAQFREEKDLIIAEAENRSRLLEERQPRPEEGDLDNELLAGIVHAVRPGLGSREGSRLAILWAHRNNDTSLSDPALARLSFLSDGSTHDQIGGGFHRKAADPAGRFPYFEKLTSTNAALLDLYLQAYQLTGGQRFREIAEGIIDYQLRQLTDRRRGGFFVGQSAETGPDRYGLYYTWTQEEVRSAAPAHEAQLLMIHFDVGPEGDIPVHPDRNVLLVAVPAPGISATMGIELSDVEESLRAGKQALLKARRRRLAPPVDRRILADVNGAMIRSFLAGYRVLGRTDCLDAAIASLDRILQDHRSVSGGMTHLPAGEDADSPLRLADQVSVARALLDAHEVAGSVDYLRSARELLEFSIETFQDPETGALSRRPAGGRVQGYQVDIADNAMAAHALDRLSYLTKEKTYHSQAESILRAFAGNALEQGGGAATYAIALEHHLRYPLRVVVIGPANEPRTGELTRAAYAVFHPGKMVLELDLVRDARRIEAIGYPPADRPVAYVCTDTACAPPVFEPERILPTMRNFARSAFSRRPLTAGPVDPS